MLNVRSSDTTATKLNQQNRKMAPSEPLVLPSTMTLDLSFFLHIARRTLARFLDPVEPQPMSADTQTRTLPSMQTYSEVHEQRDHDPQPSSMNGTQPEAVRQSNTVQPESVRSKAPLVTAHHSERTHTVSSETTRARPESEVTRLNGKLQAAETEIARLTRELAAQKSEAEDKLERTKRELKRVSDRCTRATAHAEDLEHRLHNKDREYRSLEGEVQELKRAALLASGEKQKIELLLKTRTAELQEAQVYLDKTDDTSDSEVMRCVTNLNSGIFQTAATIADAVHGLCEVDQNVQVIEEARAQLAAHDPALLPSPLLHAIQHHNHAEDPIILQIALQALVTTYLRWLCNTWDFRPGVQLEHLYASIQQNEPQSVAGRWRALTRVHVKTLSAGDVQLQQEGEKVLVTLIRDVLLACGVPQTPLDDVNTRFGSAIDDVVRLALEFQKMSGEMIISRDLTVTIAPIDAVFDPALMDDEWGRPAKGKRHQILTDPILCTTRLGLTRQERRDGSDGDGAVFYETTLIKPTVVLTSMLDELYNEHVQARAEPDSDVEL
ncbi:hypothetical protein BD309DRAFT_217318 [Dichomitus squalens]|uniref:Uncharacterized protein n=1 Tax=Dichomitus squalens TaxID=114155 RepID=A0A4Q9PEX1_9APHY|nr:hypothetical protein BD309DRAFT_217318 [Dichomitus squalens]TBU52685.1 hypothetical protein BD310DRAFT_209376 [Dichomitus squalens]